MRTERAGSPLPSSPFLSDGSLAADVDAADAGVPTAPSRWRASPVGAVDAAVLNEPARDLWIAVALRGNGRATPRLSQLRLDDDASTWLARLPELYRRDDETRAFLRPALGLFADVMAEAESHLEELIRDMDPGSAPDDRTNASWLAWLAGWLAFPLADTWSETQRRSAVASAFALEATRGTAESLVQLIALYAGATVRIIDPAASQHLWTLGSGRLGLDTMVTPVDPHGTVLDTVAALDRTHLLDVEHEGAPPFAALANHFCVEAYAADFATDDARRELKRVMRPRSRRTSRIT
jgi:phage tail-like protein